MQDMANQATIQAVMTRIMAIKKLLCLTALLIFLPQQVHATSRILKLFCKADVRI